MTSPASPLYPPTTFAAELTPSVPAAPPADPQPASRTRDDLVQRVLDHKARQGVTRVSAASEIIHGHIELPDGQTYTVSALSVRELIALAHLQKDEAPDEIAVPVYLQIAQRVTLAPLEVLEQLSADRLTELLLLARFGTPVDKAAPEATR